MGRAVAAGTQPLRGGGRRGGRIAVVACSTGIISPLISAVELVQVVHVVVVCMAEAVALGMAIGGGGDGGGDDGGGDSQGLC